MLIYMRINIIGTPPPSTNHTINYNQQQSATKTAHRTPNKHEQLLTQRLKPRRPRPGAKGGLHAKIYAGWCMISRKSY